MKRLVLTLALALGLSVFASNASASGNEQYFPNQNPAQQNAQNSYQQGVPYQTQQYVQRRRVCQRRYYRPVYRQNGNSCIKPNCNSNSCR